MFVKLMQDIEGSPKLSGHRALKASSRKQHNLDNELETVLLRVFCLKNGCDQLTLQKYDDYCIKDEDG